LPSRSIGEENAHYERAHKSPRSHKDMEYVQSPFSHLSLQLRKEGTNAGNDCAPTKSQTEEESKYLTYSVGKKSNEKGQ